MKKRRFENVWDAIEGNAREAANLRARSELMIALQERLRASKLTQARAAQLLGVTQPRVSDLMRGKIDLFSPAHHPFLISAPAGGKRRSTADERFEHDDFRVGMIDDRSRHRHPVLYPDGFFMARSRIAQRLPVERAQFHGAEAQAEIALARFGLDVAAGAANSDGSRRRRDLAAALPEDREQTARHHAHESRDRAFAEIHAAVRPLQEGIIPEDIDSVRTGAGRYGISTHYWGTLAGGLAVHRHFAVDPVDSLPQRLWIGRKRLMNQSRQPAGHTGGHAPKKQTTLDFAHRHHEILSPQSRFSLSPSPQPPAPWFHPSPSIIRPAEYVMVFSQHLVGNAEKLLSYHGAGIQLPQSTSYLPSAEFLNWHEDQVFKKPGRDAN